MWGIDLGGTKIEGVVIDPASPNSPLIRRRVATEKELGYDHILGRIVGLVEEIAKELGTSPAQVGIGTPGVTDPDSGNLKNSNTVCLNGRPFIRDLSARLDLEVVAANDANCFALAEARMGAAQGFATVFGVIMGTGVGGGLVVHGRVLEGRHGIAGEWGHNPLDPHGAACYCGKVGCVETVLSGPSIERRYRELGGEPIKLPKIVSLAEAGDPTATRLLDETYEWFGNALSVVVNIFDPDAIVLGGGVGNVAGFYTEGIARIEKHVFNPSFSAKVLKPTLGDSAGVFGAAFLTA